MSAQTDDSGAGRKGPAEIRAREEVARELAKVPGLRFDVSEQRIRIEPLAEDGFPIEIFASGNGSYTVFFSAWHEEFLDEDSALDCFFFGLCEDCRLQVTARGRFDYCWTMQALEDGKWSSYSTTALLFFPFWRPKSVRYLQNRILRPPGSEVKASD